jgi:hypothetical protein
MSFANAPGMHLQHLVLDPNSTNDEKIGCLRILRTVVKNLADPSKSADPKYRQLRLSNDRVRARLSPCPAALDYMKALGFVVVVVAQGGGDGAGECLRLDRAMAPSDAEASLAELDGAIGMLVPRPGGAEQRRRSSSSVEEERGGAAAAAAAPDPASSAPPPGGGATTATGRVSEKERVRALLEKKRQAEAREAKEARRRTSDLIKQGEEKKFVPPHNIHVVPLSFFFARPCLHLFLKCSHFLSYRVVLRPDVAVYLRTYQ